jgi:hypothetical protein
MACSFRLRNKAGAERTISARKWSKAFIGIEILQDSPARFESDNQLWVGVSCVVGRVGEEGESSVISGRTEIENRQVSPAMVPITVTVTVSPTL